MNGFFNIFKPSGITSRDVVSKVKKLIKQSDVGHMGTLDPMASGVLPIPVGKATRLFDFFLHKQKEYKATFLFGAHSETLDTTSEMVYDNAPVPSVEQIVGACQRLTGVQDQIPPNFSAKHINGTKAYKLARRGVDFELQPKRIEISKLSLLDRLGEREFCFLIQCSGGTYIRSIARDMGAMLGTTAVMSALERTCSGVFCIDQAVSLERLYEDYSAHIITMPEVLSSVERVDAPEECYRLFLNGVKCELKDLPQGLFSVYCRGELFGLAQSVEGKIKFKTWLFCPTQPNT